MRGLPLSLNWRCAMSNSSSVNLRRLRGRSYPRSLASELYVRVSPHTAQAWNNAPRYPVRTSIRDTVSTQLPFWHEPAYDNWGVQECGSLTRCFHLSLCERCGGYASQFLSSLAGW